MTTQAAKEERFDCVAMMHQGAARVQEELKDKSPAEQAEYWRNHTGELLKRQAEVKDSESQSAG